MRIFVSATAAAAFALLISGCGAVKGGGGAANADSIEKAIKADEAKWQADLKAKDISALASHYTDDAYSVTSGTAADGSTEIRKLFANATTDPAFKLQFQSDKVEAASSGDVAYSRGHFTEQYTDEKSGKVMSGSGSYLSVFKKQEDGSWKMAEDFAALDPATVKAVTPQVPATRAKMVSF